MGVEGTGEQFFATHVDVQDGISLELAEASGRLLHHLLNTSAQRVMRDIFRELRSRVVCTGSNCDESFEMFSRETHFTIKAHTEPPRKMVWDRPQS